jgi:hypothetical protein
MGSEMTTRLRAGVNAEPDFIRQEKTFIAHFDKKPIDTRIYEIGEIFFLYFKKSCISHFRAPAIARQIHRRPV